MSSSLSVVSLYICDACHHRYQEPRILPCLHTFCTSCLEKLEPFTSDMDLEESSDNLSLILSQASIHGSVSSYRTNNSSIVSMQTTSEVAREDGIRVLCPTCKKHVKIPKGGVQYLPLNHILLNSMAVETMSAEPYNLLCDLCASEVGATNHCVDCLANLCTFCSEAHSRQKKTSSHQIITLAEAQNLGIHHFHKPVYCRFHPSIEIQYFCTSCIDVMCKNCSTVHNQNHKLDTISNMAEKQVGILETLILQTKPNIELIEKAIKNIHETNSKLKIHITNVTDHVNTFIDGYVVALEMHRQHLLRQIQRVQVGRQRVLRMQQVRLEQLLNDLTHWETFVNNLLSEGTSSVILSLFGLVTQFLKCAARLKVPLEPRISDKVEFLPREPGSIINGYILQGQLQLQEVSPNHCLLKGNDLYTSRQNSVSKLLLLVRDLNSQPLIRGQDDVRAELVAKDDPKKKVPVTITDRKDGSYLLTFKPDHHGHFFFHVTIGGKHIKGSPFSIFVKPPWRKHSGVFHCCSFCSSNGHKEAYCACGGTMPGGYKGCGHGHQGHPGDFHWSCCGKMSKNSECSKSNRNTYECTL